MASRPSTYRGSGESRVSTVPTARRSRTSIGAVQGPPYDRAPVTEQEQVEALYARQATTDLEHELVESHPARVDPYRDRASHVVDLYEVVLETGRLTFFKPVNAYQNA